MPLSYVMQEVRDSDGHQENYYQTRTGYSEVQKTFKEVGEHFDEKELKFNFFTRTL